MKILDLDNCISDDGWRVPTIDHNKASPLERYHRYHSLAPWDCAVNGELFAGDEPISILTARPILYREATLDWLRRHGVYHVHLIMRNNTDHRPSVDLKRAQLNWLLTLYGVALHELTVAYDDRHEIVEMYRSYGIKAERRAIHNLPYSQSNAKPKSS